jgi:hypothetical protein
MDNMSPTIERLRHADSYDTPERSQTVNRVAYRVKTPFEALEARGAIGFEHLQAARKLERHYVGAQGVHVGNGDGIADPDCEFPQIYHGQQVAAAWRQITADEKRGLEALIEETATLEQIGRRWMGCKDKGRAIIAGQALITTGLERLAVHWRFKRSEP